jgi:hypothetical protein
LLKSICSHNLCFRNEVIARCKCLLVIMQLCNGIVLSDTLTHQLLCTLFAWLETHLLELRFTGFRQAEYLSFTVRPSNHQVLARLPTSRLTACPGVPIA